MTTPDRYDTMAKPSSPVVQFDHFYTYEEIDRLVRSWAEAFPNLCRLGSIGQSPEGREIHLLTLTDFTTGSPEERPAYVIHGGISRSRAGLRSWAALHRAETDRNDKGPLWIV